MRAVLAILFTAAIFAPSAARADQCQLVDSPIATRALELARKSASVIDYCEPCRGANLRGPFKIMKAEIRNRQVEINGKPVDLAYTFIHTTGDEYTNLGLAAGCPAKNVSRVIKSSQTAQTPPLPPPPPPTGTFPPRPPMPRVTAGDDLAGTWTVSIRGSVSTCGPAATTSRTATWTIASSGGSLSLMTEDGREMIAPVPALDRNSIRVELKDRRQPQSGVLQVSQFLKDSFYAKLLHVSNGCATVFDVSGKRVP